MASENSQSIGRVVEMQVSSLIGPALDWAVAQAIGGYRGEHQFAENGASWPAWIFPGGVPFKATSGKFEPSTDWAQGGPLRDKYQVEILECYTAVHAKLAGKTNAAGHGETALIAICRAIVAARLDEVVSVPAELVENNSCE